MNQEKRKALCSEVQKTLAEDLPYLPMRFILPSTGNYNFLTTLHPDHN